MVPYKDKLWFAIPPGLADFQAESGVRRSVAARDDLDEWLEANTTGYWELGHEHCALDDSNRVIGFSSGVAAHVPRGVAAYQWVFTIGFVEERDATLFKMFWL